MRIHVYLLALGVIATSLLMAASKSVVAVTVTDQHEKPVDNAAVILDFLGSRQVHKLGRKRPIHWEVRTNQQGRAHFPAIPQGTIQLQVVARNHQTFGKKFEADEENKNLEIQLNPPQQQYSAHDPLKPADAPKNSPSPK